MTLGCYDVVVIGAGHAGIEAAVASARLGVKTGLFTLTLDGIGNMPCNPAIGGTAKGHLVREIDALGGVMGEAADATFIQSRMLNKGKGPAVHSLRVQSDRKRYHMYMKQYVEKVENLEVKQAEIVDIDIKDGQVYGVTTHLGAYYEAKCVIIATGTYLGGKIFVGDADYASGPDGHHAANKLTESLRKAGVELHRFKTGTPARVNRRSIDFSALPVQEGDVDIQPLSFMTEGELKNQVVCHITYTNLDTHAVIQKNIHRSPLYGGKIEGIGPRYCPSIEDKVMRFADKDKHQIFIEPCGLDTDEMYLQGMSSSLPEDVQNDFYHTIKGLENVEIMRPAYAIEYDCCNPLNLYPTLEDKKISGLFGAGQFNGSSGYEEAAAQGLVAGINAAKKVLGQKQYTFPRQNSYIGTLIDDLVTKGVSDPYRMMTSRSEYRLFLRQDNADERLTPIGREIGLVSDEYWNAYNERQRKKEAEIARLNNTTIKPAQINPLLEKKGTTPLTASITAAEIMKRPQVSYSDVTGIIGEDESLNPLIINSIETEIKYNGYIKRQQSQINAVKRLENTPIPEDFVYETIDGIRLEAREKLAKVSPQNLGQAGRISGVSPADIGVLSIALTLHKKQRENEE